MRLIDYRLYLTTDDFYLDNSGVYRIIEKCLQSGVTVLQYRAKKRTARVMMAEAGRLKDLCNRYKVPLIINDRLDIALAVDADGLHLGQDDLPLSTARKLFSGKIIGVSANTYEEASDALIQGADYVGVGPVYPTVTKSDAKQPCGVSVISRLKEDFPAAKLVAIGGIDINNVRHLIETGVDGVAVISSIFGSNDPQDSVRRFVRAWNNN